MEAPRAPTSAPRGRRSGAGKTMLPRVGASAPRTTRLPSLMTSFASSSMGSTSFARASRRRAPPRRARGAAAPARLAGSPTRHGRPSGRRRAARGREGGLCAMLGARQRPRHLSSSPEPPIVAIHLCDRAPVVRREGEEGGERQHRDRDDGADQAEERETIVTASAARSARPRRARAASGTMAPSKYAVNAIRSSFCEKIEAIRMPVRASGQLRSWGVSEGPDRRVIGGTARGVKRPDRPRGPSAPRARARRDAPRSVLPTAAMPELPEVEVTRRRIEPLLVGRRIAEVDDHARQLLLPDAARPAAPAASRAARSERSSRRGKYLVAELDDASRLLLHLGMTGQLFAEPAPAACGCSRPRAARRSRRSAQARFRPDAHTHLRFEFEDGGGRGLLPRRAQVRQGAAARAGRAQPRLDRLGTDALEVDRRERSSRRRVGAESRSRPCCSTRRCSRASGNIYADEALFLAGGPAAPPARGRVTRGGVRGAGGGDPRACCERSIETGGSSISDYVAPDGARRRLPGRAARLRAGGRSRACAARPRSGAIVIGQRSTHYCPRCQR